MEYSVRIFTVQALENFALGILLISLRNKYLSHPVSLVSFSVINLIITIRNIFITITIIAVVMFHHFHQHLIISF